MVQSASVVPLANTDLKQSDLEDPNLTLLNQILKNISQSINSLGGHAGPIKLANHLDMGGKSITGVGDPIVASDPTSVVTKLVGDSNYGPAVVSTKMEALSKNVMKTYRRLSDPNQREKSSSFLNQVLNTAPTSNTSFVSFGAPSAGTVAATVGAGFHQRVDGSVVPYSSRTDTVALPVAVGITSLTRSTGEVTAVTSSAHGLVQNEGFTVVTTGDPSFLGTFVVLQVLSPTSFIYVQSSPDASTSGGTISIGGVYYYTLTHGQSSLGLVGGFSSDTWSNRVAASRDGTTIIAVVVTNSGGGNSVQSAGGATPPQTGAAVAVIRRL